MSVQTLPVAPHFETYSDDQLARRVHNFLINKQPHGSDRLAVDADGGIITLRGIVSTFYQKQLYIHGAQRVAGVLRVIDELDVRPARAW